MYHLQKSFDLAKDEIEIGIGIHGEPVARDTYTAFLIYNIKDTENIDREACLNDFENYLTLQYELVENVRRLGDNTKTFGLNDFPAA